MVWCSDILFSGLPVDAVIHVGYPTALGAGGAVMVMLCIILQFEGGSPAPYAYMAQRLNTFPFLL